MTAGPTASAGEPTARDAAGAAAFVRKRLPPYVLIAAVLGFTISLLMGLSELYRHRSAFQEEYKINVWLVAQTQFELVRLLQTLDRYVSDVDPASHDELAIRLDIFWSRIPILMSGEESQTLRHIPGFPSMIRSIQDDLVALEDDILSLRRDDRARYREIRARLDAYTDPLYDAVLATVASDTDKLEANREAIRRVYLQVTISILGAVIGGAIVIFFLQREIRRAGRLLKSAHDAEQDAREARSQLSEAIQSISEGFVLYGPDRKLSVANDKLADIYSTVREMIVPGVDFEALCLAAVARGQYVGIDTVEAARAATLLDYDDEGEHEFEMANGRWIRMTRRRTADGGCVSVHSDISELKNRERELAAKSRQLQATLDNISQGVSVFDQQLKLGTSNARFARLLDLPAELAAPGCLLPEILEFQRRRGDFGDGERDFQRAWMLAGTADPGVPGLEIALANGTVLELHRGAMPDGGIVVTYTDITARRAAEKRHEALLDEIHQSQKMQAIGTLAGGIAHDFNNILASILGNAELALDDLAEDHPAAESVVQIRSAGVRAQRVVQQILAFSRHEVVSAKPIRLDRVLDETLDLLRATLPSSTELVVRKEAAAPTIVGDATQMHQALMNLCVNAAQAIGKGAGTIEVELREVEVDGRRSSELAMEKKDGAGQPVRVVPSAGGRGGSLWVGLLQAGPHAKLTVRDNGCGMAYDTMSRILEPFFTTKGVGSGTGLGLSAVHGIVAKHHGAMVVKSALGAGASFSILLPLVPAAKEPEPAPSAARRLERQGNERVLIVDDETQLVDTARRTLQRAGFDTVGMTNSVEALETFRADPGRWDLVILDQTMPKLSGMELAAEMLRIRPGTPIVLCTGFSLTADEDSAQAAGIREFVMKPVVGRALTELVRRVIDTARREETA